MTLIAFPAATLAEAVRPRTRPSLELTEIERSIAHGVADGRPEDAIGRDIGLTRDEVHYAVTRLMDRLDCRTPAHLVARLMRAGKVT